MTNVGKVGPKGQVVIPKALRERLGIRPGDHVMVDEVEGSARVRRLPSVRRLRGLLKQAGGGIAAFEAEKRRELEREERRIESTGRPSR